MITRLPIASVKQNTGQIEGLPSNPRQWTQTDIDRIAKSLEETPELFEARPLIVYLNGADYVILGGNLRYEGAKKNKMKDVPVHILPPDLSIEKLKEIVIKDNGSFGDWDMDMLANEWDDLPLKEWGVDAAWDVKDVEEVKEKPDLSNDIDVRFCVEITCVSEKEQEMIYNEMLNRGFECRILTL
jgi:ParB-like chromosome segregation protein Spo0J